MTAERSPEPDRTCGHGCITGSLTASYATFCSPLVSAHSQGAAVSTVSVAGGVIGDGTSSGGAVGPQSENVRCQVRR